MRTRNQEYALRVYQQVSSLSAAGNDLLCKRYGSLAHRLPVLIRAAGLAQALGFVKARGGDAGTKLLDHIASATQEESLRSVESVAEADLTEYMRLTRTAMAALVWYKRFARSILGIEQGMDGGNDQ